MESALSFDIRFKQSPIDLPGWRHVTDHAQHMPTRPPCNHVITGLRQQRHRLGELPPRYTTPASPPPGWVRMDPSIALKVLSSSSQARWISRALQHIQQNVSLAAYSLLAVCSTCLPARLSRIIHHESQAGDHCRIDLSVYAVTACEITRQYVQPGSFHWVAGSQHTTYHARICAADPVAVRIEKVPDSAGRCPGSGCAVRPLLPKHRKAVLRTHSSPRRRRS